MTHTAITNVPSARTSEVTVDAVLFDLSGTLIDESYLRHGLTHVAAQIQERWGIDPTLSLNGFMPSMRRVSAEVADQRFYLMCDVLCATLDRLIRSCGHVATRGELVHLEQQVWEVAIPASVAADGAIETLTLLRDAGIGTGIVSYADTPVFDGLLRQTGLAGLTDVELCSEMARSCKPDPTIFLQALDAVGVSPDRAMFVGDSIDADIVGGNRVGMQTALLSAREFNLNEDPANDPLTQPDHHIGRLLDVVDLAVHRQPARSPAGALDCESGALPNRWEREPKP